MSTLYNKEKEELLKFLEEQKPATKEKVTEVPDVPEYERLEYENLSDEEVAARAKSELAGYENESKNAIENETEAAKTKYETDKKSAESAAQSGKKETENAYVSAKKALSDDLLKRGLARSSVAANRQTELENAKASKITNIMNGYTEKIAEIDSEISGLSLKREKALNDFNISYAARLTEKINDLKSELEKNKTEAIKYNNTLTDKEYSQNVGKIETESDLYSKSLTQSEKEKSLGLTEPDYKVIYDKMYEMLSKLSKPEARDKLLNDRIFKENLSAYYYYELYDKFFR